MKQINHQLLKLYNISSTGEYYNLLASASTPVLMLYAENFLTHFYYLPGPAKKYS